MTEPITARAKLRYLRITSKKVRPVAKVIKGMTVERAIAELESRGKKASPVLLRLLRSAVANAVNVHKLNREALVIKSILVDPGPSYKRMLPRAMGRATPILKRTSHVTITLEEGRGIKTQTQSLFRSNKAWRESLKELPAVNEGNLSREMPKEDLSKASTRADKVDGKIDSVSHPRKKIPSAKKQSRGFMPKIFQRKAI